MRHGFISRRKALFPVMFRLPGQFELTREFVVDTGFSEFLTLPFHSATVLWNDQEREVRVVATGRRSLLGTALLNDQELRV
jgi:predicted aspartyl protease